MKKLLSIVVLGFLFSNFCILNTYAISKAKKKCEGKESIVVDDILNNVNMKMLRSSLNQKFRHHNIIILSELLKIDPELNSAEILKNEKRLIIETKDWKYIFQICKEVKPPLNGFTFEEYRKNPTNSKPYKYHSKADILLNCSVNSLRLNPVLQRIILPIEEQTNKYELNNLIKKLSWE